MTAVDPAIRDAVAEVLAEHWTAESPKTYDWRCQCGEPMPMTDEDHQRHVADALAPLIARLRAEAADEALAEVQRDLWKQLDETADPSDPFCAGLRAAQLIVAARRTGGKE